jgi:hypothetical protein
MANTSRDTAALIPGDHSAELTGRVTSSPRPEPPSSTSVLLICQLFNELRPLLQTVAVSVVRAVETASRLHSTSGGATVSLIRGNLAGQNYYAVSAHPEQTVELPSEPTAAQLFSFALNNLSLLVHSERALGTWVNAKGIHVLDVVTCVSDRELALELGSKFSQYSVFDLAAGQELLVRPQSSINNQVNKKEVKS